MNSRTKGIVCIISAAFCFALMGLFVRLSGDVPSMQKSFFRNFVALLVVAFIFIKNHEKIAVKKADWKFLIARAGFGTVGLICNFYAIDHLVLSDASMLNKLSPFFAIIFSYIILKEKCTVVQAVAVVTAFIGALLIIKPTGDIANVPALVGAMGGLGAGIAYTMVRILGKRGVKGNVVVLFFSAFSCLVCLPFMLADFKPMTLYQTLMLVLAGVSATGGQFSITRAYMYAPAKEISVYDYSQIIFSALFGFAVLGELPDMLSVLGYIIICSMAVWMYIYNKSKDQNKE